MSWLSRLFKSGGDDERGSSADNPLLAASPADERAILQTFLCPAGHHFKFSRRGSTEGSCPDPAGHKSPFGGGCIVDHYELQCEGGEYRASLYFDMYHPDRPEPRPPKGMRFTPPTASTQRSISLHYEQDLPAWRLKTVQPSRFRQVRYELTTRLFLMPDGALLGVLLNLYDIPNQPYFIHRVMDLSDPQVARYIEACSRHGRLIALFEAKGQEDDFSREITLDGRAWREHLEQGRSHNGSISPDGDRALENFLEIFHRVSRERGVEPAWDEVSRVCLRHGK